MGEVAIAAREGGFEMRHYMDLDAEGLTVHEGAKAAREIALYDEEGNYRPLKTAPNLRRGWMLVARNLEELEKALDGFYPAMLGARLAFEERRLAVTALRETLGRQSGMYAITKRLTETQANALAGSLCNLKPGCLKRILWPIEPGVALAGLPGEKFAAEGPEGVMPMLCAEACNLFVAKAREIVKGVPSPTPLS